MTYLAPGFRAGAPFDSGNMGDLEDAVERIDNSVELGAAITKQNYTAPDSNPVGVPGLSITITEPDQPYWVEYEVWALAGTVVGSNNHVYLNDSIDGQMQTATVQPVTAGVGLNIGRHGIRIDDPVAGRARVFTVTISAGQASIPTLLAAPTAPAWVRAQIGVPLPVISAPFTVPDWASGVTYDAAVVVRAPDASLVRANLTHTSSAGFAADVAANLWTTIVNAPAPPVAAVVLPRELGYAYRDTNFAATQQAAQDIPLLNAAAQSVTGIVVTEGTLPYMVEFEAWALSGNVVNVNYNLWLADGANNQLQTFTVNARVAATGEPVGRMGVRIINPVKDRQVTYKLRCSSGGATTNRATLLAAVTAKTWLRAMEFAT